MRSPVVSELEISRRSREREELDCTNREIEGDVMKPVNTLESMEENPPPECI